MNSSQGWATAMEKDIAMQKAIQKTEISKAEEDEEEDVKCKIQKVALDKDDLKCPACLNYLRPDRIYQCSKGHMVCSICQPRLTQCPTCRCGNGFVRSLIAERVACKMFSDLNIYCRYTLCGARGKYNAIAEHERNIFETADLNKAIFLTNKMKLRQKLI